MLSRGAGKCNIQPVDVCSPLNTIVHNQMIIFKYIRAPCYNISESLWLQYGTDWKEECVLECLLIILYRISFYQVLFFQVMKASMTKNIV